MSLSTLVPYFPATRAESAPFFAYGDRAPVENFVHKTGMIIADYYGKVTPATLLLHTQIQGAWGRVWTREIDAENYLAYLFREGIFKFSWQLSLDEKQLDLFRYRMYPVLHHFTKATPFTRELTETLGRALKEDHKGALYISRGNPTQPDSILNLFSFYRTGTEVQVREILGSPSLTLSFCFEDRPFTLGQNAKGEWEFTPISYDLTLGHEYGHALQVAKNYAGMMQRQTQPSAVWKDAEERRNCLGGPGDKFYEVAIARVLGENERVAYRGGLHFDRAPKILQLLSALTIGADGTVLKLMRERHISEQYIKEQEASLEEKMAESIKEQARQVRIPYEHYKNFPGFIQLQAEKKAELRDSLSKLAKLDRLFDLAQITEAVEDQIVDIYVRNDQKSPTQNATEEEIFLEKQKEHIETAYFCIIAGLIKSGRQEQADRVQAKAAARFQKINETEERIWRRLMPSLLALKAELDQICAQWGFI